MVYDFEHVEDAFALLYAHAQQRHPTLRARLVIDPQAGVRGGKACARAFAYCAPDRALPRNPKTQGRRARGAGYVIGVAPKIAQVDDFCLEALLCHELAHAVLLNAGNDTHTERDADACAEREFGVRIYYDNLDVQTTNPFAKGARRPRPAYLDDADGFTK